MAAEMGAILDFTKNLKLNMLLFLAFSICSPKRQKTRALQHAAFDDISRNPSNGSHETLPKINVS